MSTGNLSKKSGFIYPNLAYKLKTQDESLAFFAMAGNKTSLLSVIKSVFGP
jgi:hypothetical protein